MKKKRGRGRAAVVAVPKQHSLQIAPKAWLVISIIVGLVCTAVLFDPKPSIGGDNAAYISLAKSILQGKGYVELWSPGEPAHVQYPPGYPLLIAPLVLLFPASVVPLKLLSALLFLATMLLVYQLLVRNSQQHHWNAGVLVLIAINPLILEFTHLELSEIACLFFCTLSLVLFDQWRKRGGPVNGYFAAMVLSLAAAFYIRTQAVVILAVPSAYLLLKREYKKSTLLLIAVLALILPWMIRNRLAMPDGGGYARVFFSRNEWNADLGTITLGEFLLRPFTNFRIYLMQFGAQHLFPGAEQQLWLGFIVAGCVVLGLVKGIIEELQPYQLLFIFWLLLLLFWPSAGSSSRYLIPVAPFLFLFFIDGVHFIGQLLLKKGAGAMLAISLVLSVGLNAVQVVRQADENLPHLKEYLSGDEFAGYPPNWVSFYQAADWIRQHTPNNAVFICRKPTLFYMRAGRKATSYPFTTNRDKVLATTSAADFVVVDRLSSTTTQFLVPAIEPLIGKQYTIAYGGGNPPTYVLKVIKEHHDAQ